MPTNYEWLLHMDGEERQAWFDAEHVDNTRSAKRAAAVERLRDYENWSDHVKKSTLAKAVIGADSWGSTWQENRDALIDLLTDDDGLRNNDGVAAEHGATRMTNLERLFVDSEQFRQAVSAFAFANSDDCPTSPTQMVDWLMAPYVDAQSKDQSKMEPNMTEQSESLSDDCGQIADMSQKSADCVRSEREMSANDDLAPESDVTADAVDANDETATCNNSTENVIHDSREKLEADAIQLAQNIWHQGQNYANGVREVRHIAWQERDVIKLLDRQAAITRKTEQAAWIQQANGLIHEANVERDELRDELAKRDKGIARLNRQRDEARRELKKWEELTANIELPDYPFVQFQPKDKDRLIDRLTHERDEARDFLTSSENLNADLRAMNDALADDNDRLEAERDEWKAKAEQAERAMNRAAGKWAKADMENRELRKMLVLDDDTIEEYTERADPSTALEHQKQLAEEWRDRCHNAEALCDKLEAERDKLQGTVDNLRAECDECVYKQEFRNMDRLEAERDALAHDLQDCEQQRERLRQALGTAIDHAHEIVSLVNLDGEVIG